MKKIFITRRIPQIAKQMLEQHFIVEQNNNNSPLPPQKVSEIVKTHDGILSTVSEKLMEEVLAEASVEAISNYAVGLDNIDKNYAKKKGIAVYNTPDVVTHSTADMTFALLLNLIRKIPFAQKFVKDNKWTAWDPELFLGEELFGKTLGIIGLGKIGLEVAKRAQGFGLKILYYNRSTKAIDEPHLYKVCRQVDLLELLQESDYISIHVPLTPQTKNFINQDSFSLMKKKPIVLNLARGSVISTDALLYALCNKQIRGVALDVTNPEPLPGNHPLLAFENCIIVPHIGTATKECRHNMAALAAQNLIDHFIKKPVTPNY